MTFDLRFVAVALAIALQIQVTLPLSETGIRVSLSDLCLPPVLFVLVLKHWPVIRRLDWIMPRLPVWLVALSGVMTVALFIGHAEHGDWTSWALVNKYAGWFALVCYLLVGSAVARIGGAPVQAEFLKFFLGTAVLVAAVNSLSMPFLLPLYSLPVGIEFGRATGIMQNSNTFGFLLVVAILLTLATLKKPWVFASILLVGLWFTGSRGALAALIVGIAVLGILQLQRLKPLVLAAPLAAVGAAALSLLSFTISPQLVTYSDKGSSPVGFISTERVNTSSPTVRERKRQTLRALDSIKAAPVFGIGLGTYVAKTGVTVHNSLLWLLVEAGALGALMFAGFFFTVLWYLFQGREEPLCLAMIAIAAAFMAMSVTGEFLYQRHLWFLLGMALVRPEREALGR
ncbi:MAG: O-antigen ligase family protein [Alphaproteobacteria bacterium]|nr:O-antigen ligase family protein [Alphaproteobacteria bacterium]